jgi:hypothetical protein
MELPDYDDTLLSLQVQVAQDLSKPFDATDVGMAGHLQDLRDQKLKEISKLVGAGLSTVDMEASDCELVSAFLSQVELDTQKYFGQATWVWMTSPDKKDQTQWQSAMTMWHAAVLIRGRIWADHTSKHSQKEGFFTGFMNRLSWCLDLNIFLQCKFAVAKFPILTPLVVTGVLGKIIDMGPTISLVCSCFLQIVSSLTICTLDLLQD